MRIDSRKALLIAIYLVAVLFLVMLPKSDGQTPQSQSLLLSPGDLVHISVYDVPELEEHVRIEESGDITFALIGKIAVAGMIPSAAEQKISDALAAGRFMHNIHVNVVVEQYANADITVIGQVQHPGKYFVTAPCNIMAALAMAGGLTPVADIHITVKRRNGLGETTYSALPNDPDVALVGSIMVYPGDIVIVPKAGIIYVLGDVARPGGYVMNDDAQLTVMQALALAAGTTKTSAEGHARLVRQAAGGPQEVELHLKAMERGKEPDVLLKPADILYVPYSTAKNIMLGASSILSSTGGAAIYAAH